MDQSWHKNSLKGQSLVEMAIVTPLLIFILLGLLEVGYALRNYLIIINASREGARAAARPNYLTDEGTTVEDSGADKIIIHTRESMGGLLEFGSRDNGSVVLTFVDVEVSIPCDYSKVLTETTDSDFWPSCNCSFTTPYSMTIEHAWQYQDPVTYPVKSRINLEEFSKHAAVSNDQHNCQRIKKYGLNLEESDRDVVVVEVMYEHHQLFGFPIISNPFTDPINLTAYTIMRRNEVRRSPFE